MFKSLNRKVLAFIVLLMVICVIAFTSVSYYEIQKSVTGQMKSDGTTLVLDIKREIIQNNISDLNALHQILRR